MRPTCFADLARNFGGVADPGIFTQGGAETAWLGPILRGLESLVAQYDGDTNQRGDAYRAQFGLFDSMDINGAADRSLEGQLFGITLGACLRLQFALKLWLFEDTSETRKTLDYLLSAHADASEPAGTAALLARALRPDMVPVLQHRTFYAVGFVFMHEAFHTLVGHADFVRCELQLSIDELAMAQSSGGPDNLMQAIELEADGAAFSNFWFTLRQNPRFGVAMPGEVDLAERIGEATMAAMTALLAIEARRARLGRPGERTHPFPSRRITSILRLLMTYERRGVLPPGCRAQLGRKARALRSSVDGMAIAPLVDLIGQDREIDPDDAVRLGELIAFYREELSVFEQLSYAPRIALAGGSTF